MKSLITIFAGIFALCIVFPVFAEDLAHLRTISVSGEAREDIAPDQAILSMSLASKDKELNIAKKNNDEMVERLVSIVREFKISKEKVATSNVNISPEYQYVNVNNINQQKLIGYNVVRSLRVTMDDITINERLLSAIVDAKIDQVNGVEFQLADPEKHAASLRLKAFDDAKAKAQALAQAAGSKLGQPISISTDNVSPITPFPRPMLASSMGMAKAAESIAPSLPGMVALHETVEVTFALE